MNLLRRHKLLSLTLGFLLLVTGIALGSDNPSPVPQPASVTQTVAPSYVPVSNPDRYQEASDEAGLSNNNRYENVDGESVHSPAYTEDDSVPPGASAECRDGTYSFSQHRQGTCSHHGGVASWL